MKQETEVVTTPYVHETQEVEVTQLAVKDDSLVRGGTLFDLPVEEFQAGLDRRGTNHKALIRWVRAALVEGVDFGSIQLKGRPSRPSLWKPGAEKICGKLGVTVHFPSLKDYEQAALSGIAIDTIILRCELRVGPTTLAEGSGARSVTKEYGDTNKALKMAEKSAHIDATLRLAGLSEVFTQDIEDMQKEQDLTPALEASIAKLEADKAQRLAQCSPAVQEMLEKARHNREAAEAELAKPVGACDKCGEAVQIFTAKAGHRYEQCKAARESKDVYAEGGHHYRKLG